MQPVLFWKTDWNWTGHLMLLWLAVRCLALAHGPLDRDRLVFQKGEFWQHMEGTDVTVLVTEHLKRFLLKMDGWFLAVESV